MSPSVLTLGCFDGFHLGHRQLISVLKDQAQKHKLRSVLALFDPHPATVLDSNQKFEHIFLREESETFLSEFKLDQTHFISFDHEMSQMSYADFIDKYLIPKFQPKILVVGYDFSLGRNKEGSVEALRKHGKARGFEVIQVPALKIDNQICSSSYIKKKISEGDLLTVKKLLNRPFFFKSQVVRGKGLGSKELVPTCNFHISDQKILPPHGVYKAQVYLDGESTPKISSLSLGHAGPKLVEVHIIETQTNSLYGKELKVEFGSMLRKISKFNNLEQLRAQIKEDIENTLKKD